MWNETYRIIFISEFNIAFGFPRSDTCSDCDSYVAKVKEQDNTSLEIKQIEQNIKKLETENSFLRKKTPCKNRSQQSYYDY